MTCLHFSPYFFSTPISIHLYPFFTHPLPPPPPLNLISQPLSHPLAGICSLYGAQGLGFHGEGNPMEGNQEAEELPGERWPSPSPKPSFLQGLLAMGQEMGMASSSADWALCPHPQRIQLTGGPRAQLSTLFLKRSPTSCFRGREGDGGWGWTMELEHRGSCQLTSRTEMPYPPISRCNSVSTQHWPKSTGRWPEITLDP